MGHTVSESDGIRTSGHEIHWISIKINAPINTIIIIVIIIILILIIIVILIVIIIIVIIIKLLIIVIITTTTTTTIIIIIIHFRTCYRFNDLGVYAPPDNINALVVGTITSPPSSSSSSASRQRRVTAERAFRLAESLNLTYCETNVRDEQMVLWILTRLVNSVIVSRVRRQSLAISIMPPLRDRGGAGRGGEKEGGRKLWKCCAS